MAIGKQAFTFSQPFKAFGIGSAAVRLAAGDGAVEDVAVQLVVRTGRVGMRHVDQVAEFGQEHLVIRALSCLGFLPAPDESLDGRGVSFGSGWHQLGKLGGP